MDFGSSLGVFSYAADANIGMLAQIGSRVSIGGFEHPMSRAFIGAFQWGQGIEHWPRVLHNNFNTKESMALKPSNERVSIGPDVWIGNNSVVTSGVEIGVGSVIGAGSVVTKDTPPYSINVGNPTRIIGFRFQKDEIDRIVSSEFWTFPIESLLSCTFITSKTFNIDTFEIEIQRLKTGLKQSS
jgi:acetyltransferase-like isoleucine patch superfamily enzyme